MMSYVPVTLFTKGGGLWLEPIGQTECDAIGVDWTIDLNKITNKGQIVVQGNLGSSILDADKSIIESNVETMLTKYGYHNGHIFNLGHGIHQNIPVEHVQYFIHAVHQQSKRFHYD